jgi:rhamnopyranosyl-N-acetylglucosaminyl-diphospho-decaprenol beta-1,3/1,4-galactofuranosyltransferase
MNDSGVCAAILTYNRPQLLLEAIRSLTVQTHPLTDVVIVDNASNDDTEQILRESGLGAEISIHYARLAHNTGMDAGFHAAIALALTLGWRWLWILDDDIRAEPDAVEQLLSSPQARAEGTAALLPAVTSPVGQPLLNCRGPWRGRQVPLRAADYANGPRTVGYSCYLGMLARRDAIERAGLPRSEMFAWSGDIEWSLRVGREGRLWLLPRSRLVHEEDPSAGVYRPGAVGLLVMARRPIRDADLWKYLYGFRGHVWLRKQHGQNVVSFSAYLGLQLLRMLLFNPDKRTRMRLFARYGLAGRRGDWRTCSPTDFADAIGRPGAARVIAERSTPPVTGMPEIATPLHRLS